MTLLEQIKADIVDAMKGQNKEKVSVLRMLKSNLQTEAINKKKELTDDEVVAVIKKQVKIRKDAVREYADYGKTDYIETLLQEIDILSVYLPEELREEEIEKELGSIFEEIKPESMKDIGLVMKAAGTRLGAKADMKLVNELVRNRLNK